MGARRTLTLDATIAVVLAGAVLAITALAHSGGDAYPTRWKREQTVVYRFDGKVPGGKFRERVMDAAKQWNKLKPALNFKKAKGKGVRYPQSQCGSEYQDDVITMRDTGGGGALGVTTWCTFSKDSEIHSFQIAFDKGREWYKGKKKPKAGQWDVFSVATHEFGHAAGRSGHFNDGGSQCKKNPEHVMCPTLPKGDKRQTAKHDKHTFKSAY